MPLLHHAGSTALIFGREESGLSEAELRQCSHACAIQTGRFQGSMNLSHAVSVVLSQVYERRLALLDQEGLMVDMLGGCWLVAMMQGDAPGDAA
jgi:tRNA C32,U32 (ribose-2'-O)-methylase TrmJ